jgi:hypothetical protein
MAFGLEGWNITAFLIIHLKKLPLWSEGWYNCPSYPMAFQTCGYFLCYYPLTITVAASNEDHWSPPPIAMRLDSSPSRKELLISWDQRFGRFGWGSLLEGKGNRWAFWEGNSYKKKHENVLNVWFLPSKPVFRHFTSVFDPCQLSHGNSQVESINSTGG